MKIAMLGREAVFEKPQTVNAVIASMAPEYSGLALGCFRGGRVMQLSDTLSEDCTLVPVTFQHEEGRRIYERSLRFVLLLAVRRVLPGRHLRIEHSIGYGLYMRLLEEALDPQTVDALQAAMTDIVAEDLPFVRETWTREEAAAYFAREGNEDQARLMAYRPVDYFPVYRCGGMAEYFYGAMLPSTGCVPVFRLEWRAPGMVLRMPSPADPSRPAPMASREKILRVFAQSNHWCDILGCMNAADLNEMTTGGKLQEFIRVNEALHDQSLSDIAQDIVRREARAVYVAGPSSSGKTTFSNRLCIHLRVLGRKPVLISLDDFYRDRDQLPLEENGRPDLEALDALDVPMFQHCMARLLRGETAHMPRFDFDTQRQTRSVYDLRLSKDQVLVVEGIHGLNPVMQEGFDPGLLCTVYISQLTCLNLDHHNRIRTTDARLLRRVVRDYLFRATSAEETLEMWDSVRQGEEKWIFPYQERADYMFNSALHYELPVLRRYAYDLLSGIPEDHPAFFRSRRLLKILHYILPAPEQALREIPPLSLLREFIGGCPLYE